MFDFASDTLPIGDHRVAAFRRVWDRIASAGTWWSGAERVAIARKGRAAYKERAMTEQSILPEAAGEAAAVIGKEPAAVTEEMIGVWEAGGLDATRYVELIAVVAQVTAVDSFHRAMGLELEPLPHPRSGEPSREPATPPATKTKAWVPMVGPPTIPTSLSAVPAEMAALEVLHGPMYLGFEEMADPAIQKGLNRAQMELVAGRTSAINECFF